MEIPIPIQNKITFEKWSRQKMKYSEHDNIYILTILSNYLKEWIDKNTDLNRIIDDDNFYEQFKRFIYKEYVRPLENYNYNIVDHEYYEHFNLKYSEEIVDIFMYYQKYTKSLNSDLFHLKKIIKADKFPHSINCHRNTQMQLCQRKKFWLTCNYHLIMQLFQLVPTIDCHYYVLKHFHNDDSRNFFFLIPLLTMTKLQNYLNYYCFDQN